MSNSDLPTVTVLTAAVGLGPPPRLDTVMVLLDPAGTVLGSVAPSTSSAGAQTPVVAQAPVHAEAQVNMLEEQRHTDNLEAPRRALEGTVTPSDFGLAALRDDVKPPHQELICSASDDALDQVEKPDSSYPVQAACAGHADVGAVLLTAEAIVRVPAKVDYHALLLKLRRDVVVVEGLRRDQAAAEQLRQADELRRAEEVRRARDEELRRELVVAQELRRAEEVRRAEELRGAEEELRLAEELCRAKEELRLAEELRYDQTELCRELVVAEDLRGGTQLDMPHQAEPENPTPVPASTEGTADMVAGVLAQDAEPDGPDQVDGLLTLASATLIRTDSGVTCSGSSSSRSHSSSLTTVQDGKAWSDELHRPACGVEDDDTISIYSTGSARSVSTFEKAAAVASQAYAQVENGWKALALSVPAQVNSVADVRDFIVWTSKSGCGISFSAASAPHTHVQGSAATSALGEAAHRGDMEGVRELLASGTSANALDEQGATPLRRAAFRGHADVIGVLLAAGANVDASNKSGFTAVHLAAIGGHHAAVGVLVLGGALLDLQTDLGLTSLGAAASKGHKDVVETLLAAGASLTLADKAGWTPLHLAAHLGYPPVVGALMRGGASPDLKTQAGYTPLHLAAHEGCSLVVEALLEGGARMDLQTQGGSTALHLAVQSGQQRVMDKLLLRGAPLELENNRGQTPLGVAAAKGRPGVLSALLLSHARVDVRDQDGMTPLMVAARDNFLETAKLLLFYGADWRCSSKEGRTALSYADELGTKERVGVVQLLQAHSEWSQY